MEVNDILNHIEISPATGAVSGSEPGSKDHSRVIADSDYRDKLAKSLNDSRSETPSSAENQSATNKPASSSASDPGELRASNSRQTTSAESPVSAVPRVSPQSSTPRDRATDAKNTVVTSITDVDLPDKQQAEHQFVAHAVEGAPPAQFQVLTLAAEIPDIILPQFETPQPPANLQQFFDELVDGIEVHSDETAEQFGDVEALSPPTGLFATPAFVGSIDLAEDLFVIAPDSRAESALTSLEGAVDPNVAFEQQIVDFSPNGSSEEKPEAEQQSQQGSVQHPSGTRGIAVETTTQESGNSITNTELQTERDSTANRSDEFAVSPVAAETALSPATTDAAGKATKSESANAPLIPVDRSATRSSETPVAGSTATSANHSAAESAQSQPTSGQPGVDQAAFIDRLSNAIRLAQQDGRQLRVRLHPPGLGTLQIEVAMRGGALSARLEVQTPSAQQAILENLSLLRHTLAQNGTTIERIDVQLFHNSNDEGPPNFSDSRREENAQQHADRQKQGQPKQNSEEHQPESRSVQDRPRIDQLDIQI